MFVELIYDKRNFAGLPGAREAILNELTKRMQRIFPEAEVRVKPMMTLPMGAICRMDTANRTINFAVEQDL